MCHAKRSQRLLKPKFRLNLSRETPLVSVLMPVRNAGLPLRAAVASILSQTYTQLELIIVNDGSTDQAIEDLVKDDPRLRFIDNHGTGIVDALNTAATLARGQLLARMDGDDIALPWRLARQVELLAQHPHIGIAGGQVKLFGESDSLGKGYQHYESWINRLVTPQDIKREIFIESPIPHPTAVFRREVFDRLGGYRDSLWAEDYDMWLRAYAAGIEMAKPEGVILHWRDTPTRLSRIDSRYTQSNFIKAKAYFLSRTDLRNKPTIIWGAGPTGRQLHDELTREGVVVNGFIDVHPRRIGRNKRGKPVFGQEHALTLRNEVIIGAVGTRGAREEIRDFLIANGKKESTDFIFAA